MTIADIMSRIRNVHYVMIHKNNGTKSMLANELEEYEYAYEFDWFEVNVFLGKPCIEFNL